MKKRFKRQKGQAIVEYVIIVVVVALAALVVLGAFSDRIRTMIAGVTSSLDNEEHSIGDSSLQQAKDLEASGVDIDSGN